MDIIPFTDENAFSPTQTEQGPTGLTPRRLIVMGLMIITLTIIHSAMSRLLIPAQSLQNELGEKTLASPAGGDYEYLGSGHVETLSSLSWWSETERSARASVSQKVQRNSQIAKLRILGVTHARVQEKTETPSEEIQAMFHLANLLELQNDLSGAVEVYDSLIGKTKGVDPHIGKARCLIGMGRLDEAIKICDFLSTVTDTSPRDLLLIGQLYFNAGVPDMGERCCLAALVTDPSTKPNQLALARYYDASGRADQARDLYEAVLSAPQSNDVPARMALVRILASQGKIQDALRHMEILMSECPRSESVQIPVALTLIRAGRFAEAQGALNQILAVDPENRNASHVLIMSLRGQKRHEEAMQIAKRLLDIDPSDVVSLSLMGDIAYERGDMVEAERSYRNALKYDPSRHEICNNLACVLFRNGRNLEEARRIAEQAVALQPQSPRYLLTLADILEKLGDVESAEAATQKAKGLMTR